MSENPTTMPPERARAINAALVGALMVRDGLKAGPVPDVTWFTPRDAVAASTMMQDSDIGRRTNADGSATLSCFVAPTRVRSLYAWALATWADSGRY